MRSQPCLLAFACVLPLAAVDQAPVAPPAPAVAVAGWIAAVKANDLASLVAALPPSRQQALQQQLRPGAPPAMGGPAAMRGMRGGPLGMLRMMGDPERGGAANLTVVLLAEVANQAMPAGAATVATAAAANDQQPWMAFVPRMMAAGVAAAPATQILAAGLETRQIAALDGWWNGYVQWARTAKLDRPETAAALAPHLDKLVKEIETVGEAADVAEAATRASAALVPAKQALAAVGLDLDAAFGAATVAAESVSATTAVVVVSFPAFGAQHHLPVKLAVKDGAWVIEADSPALRWLTPGGPMGRPMGNRNGRRGGPGPGGPGADAPPAPAQPGKPDASF